MIENSFNETGKQRKNNLNGELGMVEKSAFTPTFVDKWDDIDLQSEKEEASAVQLITSLLGLDKIDRFIEDTLVNLQTDLSEPLTRREAEVFKLIISGNTNKKIAEIICRTTRTVEYHRNSIMRKLDAHNAAEMIQKASIMGIV